MLDSDGYPDEEALEQIKKWDAFDKQGIDRLLDLVYDNTKWPDRQIYRGKKGKYVYHTGGWSGNEDVIAALMGNFIFRAVFWQSEERGGHFTFKIKGLTNTQ